VKLYEYFRSAASYRVRIALNLKGVRTESVHIHLLRDEQFAPAFRALNPQGRVPALVLEDATVLVQSPAILEWLEEVYPAPALLPRDAVARARVRGIAAMIACDVHPLNNVGVTAYLRAALGADDAAVGAWGAHWVSVGLAALEQMVEGPFCVGDAVTLADVHLVPQLFGARRVGVDVSAFPRLAAIEARCLALPAFAQARPVVLAGAAA
jgi:maleylacetoacetate isomerase